MSDQPNVCYSIIRDEPALKEFIDWLPELRLHERYYVSLFARRKYDQTIKGSNKANLKRFLTDKERMLSKIRQLEIPVGRYDSKGNEVDEKSLALYVTPNPRCMRSTSFNLVSQLMVRLQNENQAFNPQSVLLTTAHKSKSRTEWVDFDIDLECESSAKSAAIRSCVDTVTKIVGQAAVAFVETRGGVHCLVCPARVKDEKNWFQKITRELNVDQQGDLLLPVPGCNQGGFVPRLFLPMQETKYEPD